MWVVRLRIPPIPTRRKEQDIIFALAQLRPGQVFYDLGAGDGRLVHAAATVHRAKAFGWEINTVVGAIAWLRNIGVANITIGDLWKAPVSKADVVVTFLMPSVMQRVEKEIWPKLKSGTRLISNAFPLPTVKPTEVQGWVYLYEKP